MSRHQSEILFDNVLANPDLLDKFFNDNNSSVTCLCENEDFYPFLISYFITKGWEKVSVWDRNVGFISGEYRLGLFMSQDPVHRCSVILSRFNKKTNFVERTKGDWLTLYIN